MGGAVAVHVAHNQLIPTLIGLAVIDVVEGEAFIVLTKILSQSCMILGCILTGTALEALSSMQSFLHSRPPGFKSLEQAIEYCVRSGAVRNVDSARVSMVGQLKKSAPAHC